MLYRFRVYLLFLLSLAYALQFWGQVRDMPLTKNPDSIPSLQVISEYEPSTLLKGVEFIRPQIVTNKVKDTLNLTYKIRPASLSIPYEAIQLNPLAYEVVKRPNEYENYFSVYSGNTFIKVPKMRLSLGIGNGHNKNFRVYASHIAEKGYIPKQQYRDIEWKILGQMTQKILSLRFGVTGSWLDYYRYGLPDFKINENLKERQLRNLLQNYAGFFKTDFSVGGSVNLNFALNLDYSLLGKQSKEFASKVHLSIMQGKVNNSTISWFGTIGYKSNFLYQRFLESKPKDTANQLFFAEAQVDYQNKNIGVSGLMNVSYVMHQKRFYYLPQVYFYYKINHDIAKLHLGWESELKMHNLLNIFKQNYFISAKQMRYTTTYAQKYFIGVNGSWKDRLDYSFRSYFQQQNDLPLLVNTPNQPYNFSVYPVNRLRSIGLAGAVNYKFRNRLKVSASFENNNYLFKGEESFGLSPLVLRGSLTLLRLLKILTFKVSSLWKMGTLFHLIVDVNHNENKVNINTIGRLPSYADLSFLLRIRALRFLELYTEMHNLLHRPNPLWLYYNEMPFSVGGGLIFHFNTKALSNKGLSVD